MLKLIAKKKKNLKTREKTNSTLPSLTIHSCFLIFYSIQSPVQEAELNWPLESTHTLSVFLFFSLSRGHKCMHRINNAQQFFFLLCCYSFHHRCSFRWKITFVYEEIMPHIYIYIFLSQSYSIDFVARLHLLNHTIYTQIIRIVHTINHLASTLTMVILWVCVKVERVQETFKDR